MDSFCLSASDRAKNAAVCEEEVEIMNCEIFFFEHDDLRGLGGEKRSAWEVLCRTFFKLFWEGSDVSEEAESSDLHKSR